MCTLGLTSAAFTSFGIMLHSSACFFFFFPKVSNNLQQMVLVTSVKNKVPEDVDGNHNLNVFCLG